LASLYDEVTGKIKAITDNGRGFSKAPKAGPMKGSMLEQYWDIMLCFREGYFVDKDDLPVSVLQSSEIDLPVEDVKSVSGKFVIDDRCDLFDKLLSVGDLVFRHYSSACQRIESDELVDLALGPSLDDLRQI